MPTKTTILALLCTGLLAGCGAGSGEGLNNQGLPQGNGPGNGNGGDEPPSGVTLAQLQEDIFSPICTQCHSGAGAPQGLRLDSEQSSYDSLVNQPSGEQPEVLRVSPGEPDDSYLVHKLEGAESINGGQMPLGQPPLRSEQIADVRDWIANGAPREGTGDMPTSLTLVDVQTTDADVVFKLRFSRPVSAPTLEQSLLVYGRNGREGEQRWLLTPDQYRTELHERQLTLVIIGRSTTTDFELVVNDPRSGVILDADGRPLDGDNNRQEGGAFRYDHRQ